MKDRSEKPTNQVTNLLLVILIALFGVIAIVVATDNPFRGEPEGITMLREAQIRMAKVDKLMPIIKVRYGHNEEAMRYFISWVVEDPEAVKRFLDKN